MLKLLRKLKYNLLTVFYFFLRKKCAILYFEIPPDILMGFLEYDIIKTVSIKIEEAEKVNLNQPLTMDLPNIDSLKEILKLGWLINDIRTKGVKNPVQLIKRGNLYFCHPGTSRLLVQSYILPENKIKGIYLWYKDLDPDPFILPHSKYITNPFKFISLYSKNKQLKFVCEKITNDLNVSDIEKGSCENILGWDTSDRAMFFTIKKCFQKSTTNPNHLFIMGWDTIQWEETKNMVLSDIISFPDKNTCIFGNVKFNKKNNNWVKCYE